MLLGTASWDASSPPVCYHKKFVGTKRMQITKTKSVSRLEMFWALQATHRAMCQMGDPFAESPGTMQAWGSFVEKVIAWARSTGLVPKQNMPEFLESKAVMLECRGSCSMSCFYSRYTPASRRGALPDMLRKLGPRKSSNETVEETAAEQQQLPTAPPTRREKEGPIDPAVGDLILADVQGTAQPARVFKRDGLKLRVVLDEESDDSTFEWIDLIDVRAVYLPEKSVEEEPAQTAQAAAADALTSAMALMGLGG